MRVVLGARDRHQRWLPPKIGKVEAQFVCNALQRQLVLSAEKPHLDQFMTEVKQIEAPPGFRPRIAELLKRVPLTERESKPPVDLYAEDLATQESSKLLATLTSPEFNRLVESRAGSALRGQDRDAVFDQFLFPCAAASSGVFCLDQYMFNTLDAGRASGLIWLLQRFINAGIQKIGLLSAAPSSGHLDRCQQILKSKLVRPIGMVQKGLDVTVMFIDADHNVLGRREGGDGKLTHARHIRFSIGTEVNRMTPVFVVDPGMDAFNNQELGDDFELNEAADAKAARNREQLVARRSPQPVKISIE